MKTIIRNIIFVFGVFSFVFSSAQQITQYAQYFMNPFSINPALSGYSGQTQAYFLRNQKNLGFESGNVSNLMTIDGSVFDNKIGLGVSLMSDQMGPLSTQGGYLSLSYTVKLSEENKLGFGLSGGLADKKYDLSNAVVMDANDPMLVMGFPARQSYFDMNFGLYMDIKDLQFGFAIPQLLGNSISYTDSETNNERHYTAHLAYNLLLSETYELTLKPFARVMYVPGAPFQYDINARIDMKRIGWFNLGWRSNYSLSANLGFHIKNNIHLGYAYHFVMNNTKAYGPSQNEILLGISFGGGGSKDKRLLDEAQKERDRLMLENSKLLNEKDSLIKLKTKADVELRNEQSEKEKLNDSIAGLNSKVKEVSSENDNLKSENENLKKQLEEIKANPNNKTITVPDPNTEAENKRLKKENDDLKNQLANKSGNTTTTVVDPTMEAENKKLKKENDDLKKQLEELKANSGIKTVTVPDPNTAAENEKLKKENGDLKKQVETLKTNNSGNNNGNNSTNNSGNNGNSLTNNSGNNSTSNSGNNGTNFSGDIRKSVNDQFYEIDKTTDAAKGYYVVSGAFGSITNAEALLAKHQANFPSAKLIYNTRNTLHYVILGYSSEKTEVYSTHTKAKNSGIAKLWILDY